MSKTARVHDKSEMRKAWEGIFTSTDYFVMPFQPQIECCLLYPDTGGTLVPDYLYPALTEAARAAGDRGFYLSVTEPQDFFDTPDHWWCEFPPHDEYYSLDSGLIETATYSRDSSWGVALSHEWYALVGGPEDFIRQIDESCPVWRQDVIKAIDCWDKTVRRALIIAVIADMLEYWKRYPADEWVTTVTRNIERQLREYWQKRPENESGEWAASIAEKMNLKLDEGR